MPGKVLVIVIVSGPKPLASSTSNWANGGLRRSPRFKRLTWLLVPRMTGVSRNESRSAGFAPQVSTKRIVPGLLIVGDIAKLTVFVGVFASGRFAGNGLKPAESASSTAAPTNTLVRV